MDVMEEMSERGDVWCKMSRGRCFTLVLISDIYMHINCLQSECLQEACNSQPPESV